MVKRIDLAKKRVEKKKRIKLTSPARARGKNGGGYIYSITPSRGGTVPWLYCTACKDSVVYAPQIEINGASSGVQYSAPLILAVGTPHATR